MDKTLGSILGALTKKTLPPLFAEPIDYAPETRKGPLISGTFKFLSKCQPDPKFVKTRTLAQVSAEKNKVRRQALQEKLENQIKLFNPASDPHIQGDPASTVFVGNLKYAVSEDDLRGLYSRFGNIERLRIVLDPQNKPRGYAFVVFDRSQAASQAIRETRGMLVKGLRLIVDRQRGKEYGWKPRRLGGGIGGRAVKRHVGRAVGGRTGGIYGQSSQHEHYNGRGDGYRGRGRGGSRGAPFRSRGGWRGRGSDRSRPYDRVDKSDHFRERKDRGGDRGMNGFKNEWDYRSREGRASRDTRGGRVDRDPSSGPSERDPRDPRDPRESGGRVLRRY